jgi:hypothetical protein
MTSSNALPEQKRWRVNAAPSLLLAKVVERASLCVVSAWPAANRRIHNRQVARLLLQFPAAS